ncbi:MAG TPA: response regulator [Polyangia bacterium]|nr:response regulator [Polyangia bacterium]
MAASAKPSAPRRIFVVDDNLALAENLAELLELEGYATEVFGSAEDALAGSVGRDLAFVVTDYRLPGLDGAELVKRLKSLRGHVRAIVVSGHTDDGTASHARAAGARFLTKPIDLHALRRFIREDAAAS